ncbi:MAG: HlyD family efflux transporter periplasmic adaptor subunit [Prolixibacteraceae bacterium]|jgi:multidrug resistance efflux pump|nr:HlyD family efflux transporter periplasmic adaptor subunit [Prolixibacteraceae bacterium]MBT6005506.1 HlyD family efflux transporter periplasmic adaptor subunit [Prolixibacteraceae bacterium]MBT6764569.1 HlyD family efflux transporter periplasmic adaptor subunit [Prolixibacteraceae bacterium]MBT6998663.1 HlyD family efflux transporter periplasmic adaptor subunit [Prolixibacteraceae bacterium]MBT7397464.1 HlyD family efflux transporter periplasmic adaptor subunit [Prolixibacteraceae bacterium
MTDNNKIEIRSGEVQEILGGVPSKLVRYGILIFMIVISLIIAFTFIFRYPDIIHSKIRVTTENPPAILIARSTGIITELLVSDKQKVKGNQIIALIQNPSDYNDILKLKIIIDSVQFNINNSQLTKFKEFDRNLQLGTIQEFYSQFISKYNEFLIFVEQDYYPQINKSLKQQHEMANVLCDRLWEQKNAIDEEYKIKVRQYERQKILNDNGVISSIDFEKAESEMFGKKSELDGIHSLFAQKQIDIGVLEQRMIENNKIFLDQRNRYQSGLFEAFNNLKSEMSKWELTYLMRSPIDGVITFNKFWSVNQNVVEGDKVFTIVPENLGEVIGKVELPVRGSGKVKTGLDVIVKFDNYPYMEYGLVRGKVKNISLVSEDNFYMVEVNFPDGLVTNYNKELELQNQLLGQSEIITENLKLIQRFFNPLKSLWKERVKN